MLAAVAAPPAHPASAGAVGTAPAGHTPLWSAGARAACGKRAGPRPRAVERWLKPKPDGKQSSAELPVRARRQGATVFSFCTHVS